MFAPANAAHFTLVIPTVRNDFKVLAFEGTETISALYSVNVDLVSEYPDIDLESLLNQPAFLQFGLNGEGIHGHIAGVSVGDVGKRLTRYRVNLVPALHYLQFSHDQRIFQRQTVPQIIAKVLKGHGIQADAFTFHVKTSPEREYCTQYRENDFEFVRGCAPRTALRGITSILRKAICWCSPMTRPSSPNWAKPPISKTPAWWRSIPSSASYPWVSAPAPASLPAVTTT